MPRRGKGVPVAEGIFRYANGYRVVTKVKADGGQKERWFRHPYDPLKLVAFRANWELERRQGTSTSRHAFSLAMSAYLLTIPEHTRRHEDADRHLSAWVPAFRALDVSAITPHAIREQIAIWHTDGYAPSTINHRRQELKNLFTYLNGRSGANPVRDVKKVKETYDDARGQAPDVIEAIFAEMEPSDTKTFLRVIWDTSLPHTDITRLMESRFDPAKKLIWLSDRRKGAGVKGEVMSLTAAGVQALQAFFRAGLEGKRPSNGSMNKSFRLAVTKAREKWAGVWPAPDNLHPYDLRHSRLTEALRRSNNLQGVQKLARHKRLETTMRYVRALESESMRSVVEAMEKAGTVPAQSVKNVKIAAVSRAIDRRRSERKKR